MVHTPASAVGSDAPEICATLAVKVKDVPSVAAGELVVTVTFGEPLLTVIRAGVGSAVAATEV